VGGYGDPSVELLLAAKPTLILDAQLADEAVAKKLDHIGLRRERIICRKLDDIPTAIETIGRLVQRSAQARAVADPLRSQIAALRTTAAQITNRPSVFVEIWSDPLTTAGADSYLSDLITLAGGRNLGDEVKKDYYQISPEWVVARDPDIVLCFYMTPDSSPRRKILARSGWEHVAAVRTERVYDGFNNDVMLRPGPRVLEGIAALRKAIGGE
jgi:iron complex transport system substrate-binding protein